MEICQYILAVTGSSVPAYLSHLYCTIYTQWQNPLSPCFLHPANLCIHLDSRDCLPVSLSLISLIDSCLAPDLKSPRQQSTCLLEKCPTTTYRKPLCGILIIDITSIPYLPCPELKMQNPITHGSFLFFRAEA